MGKTWFWPVPPLAAKPWWPSSASYNIFSNTGVKQSIWPHYALWLARNSRNSSDTRQSRNLTGITLEQEYPRATMIAQTLGQEDTISSSAPPRRPTLY